MKKENMKGSKGITLVALIITIIVLLILAVVAISAVNNTGIIQHAQNSADEYTDGRDEENTTLGNYLGIINHYKPGGDKTNPPEEEISWKFEEDDGEYLLYYIGNVEELDLSQDKEIKAYVVVDNEYDENSEITTVRLSDMKEIHFDNRDNCSIKSLTLGSTICGKTYIRRCIKNLILLEGCTSIGKDFLFNDTVIESITIPSTVTSIGNDAFSGCSNSLIINYTGTKAEWNAIYTSDTGIPSGVKVICSDGEIIIGS